MSVWAAGAAVVGAVGGVYAANKQKSAAQDAANAQTESAELGIAEQRRQFDALQQVLAPYVNAGNSALGAQQNLLGLSGNDAQASAISKIQSSPQFLALRQQGNDALLSNASATGGLRGGNIQAGLAQFDQGLLAQQIQQQYANLGGLTQMGQASAAGVGAAGMQSGNAVTQLLQQQGAAQAGSALAGGRAYGQMANSITGAIGQIFGGQF